MCSSSNLRIRSRNKRNICFIVWSVVKTVNSFIIIFPSPQYTGEFYRHTSEMRTRSFNQGHNKIKYKSKIEKFFHEHPCTPTFKITSIKNPSSTPVVSTHHRTLQPIIHDDLCLVAISPLYLIIMMNSTMIGRHHSFDVLRSRINLKVVAWTRILEWVMNLPHFCRPLTNKSIRIKTSNFENWDMKIKNLKCRSPSFVKK